MISYLVAILVGWIVNKKIDNLAFTTNQLEKGFVVIVMGLEKFSDKVQIFYEKATKFCKIFPLLLTAVHSVKSKGKISQNFVAFSEYMNFNW